MSWASSGAAGERGTIGERGDEQWRRQRAAAADLIRELERSRAAEDRGAQLRDELGLEPHELGGEVRCHGHPPVPPGSAAHSASEVTSRGAGSAPPPPT